MLLLVQPELVLEQQSQLVPELQLQLVLVQQPLQPPEQFWQCFQQRVPDHMLPLQHVLALPVACEQLVLVPLAPFETALLAVPEAHPTLFQEQLVYIHFESVEPPTVESSADAPAFVWLALYLLHLVLLFASVLWHVLSSSHLAHFAQLSLLVLWPVLSSLHLVTPFDDALHPFWPAPSSFHLLFVVHSTAPFYTHDLLFLWPVQPVEPFFGLNHIALWHLQLQPFSSHSFYTLCSTQQFSVCTPHNSCPQQTSPELGQMEALEVGRMAPMLIFSADATHALWTYPCGAEGEAPQANAYAFYFHCVCDVPLHQESPICQLHNQFDGVKQTPHYEGTDDGQPLFPCEQCGHDGHY